MKIAVFGIVIVVLVVALAGVVLSQTKRADCLLSCRDAGDRCAEKAYNDHAACTLEPVMCAAALKASLRDCAVFYDSCRYACDLPSF